jgi:hypothetical protein
MPRRKAGGAGGSPLSGSAPRCSSVRRARCVSQIADGDARAARVKRDRAAKHGDEVMPKDRRFL